MKRWKKLVSRRVRYGVCFIVLLLAVSVGGMFFIFGEDTLGTLGIGGEAASQGIPKNVDNARGDELGYNESAGESLANVSFGGGSGGGSSGGGAEVVVPVCIYSQHIQYSLSDFNENAECLVYGVGGCERVKMICSSDLHNLDYDIGGIFEIKYYLTSGEEVLEVHAIEEDVGARAKTVLGIEVELIGEFDIGSLGCVVDMSQVPRRCLEWE